MVYTRTMKTITVDSEYTHPEYLELLLENSGSPDKIFRQALFQSTDEAMIDTLLSWSRSPQSLAHRDDLVLISIGELIAQRDEDGEFIAELAESDVYQTQGDIKTATFLLEEKYFDLHKDEWVFVRLHLFFGLIPSSSNTQDWNLGKPYASALGHMGQEEVN